MNSYGNLFYMIYNAFSLRHSIPTFLIGKSKYIRS
jgi:hypothetical protein